MIHIIYNNVHINSSQPFTKIKNLENNEAYLTTDSQITIFGSNEKQSRNERVFWDVDSNNLREREREIVESHICHHIH